MSEELCKEEYAKQEAINYLAWFINAGYEAESMYGKETVFTEWYETGEKKITGEELYERFKNLNNIT